MPFGRWWRYRQFVDWRLGIKGEDEAGTNFDAEGWADFDG